MRCSADGCRNQALPSEGRCRAHHELARGLPCAVSECPNTASRGDLCWTHLKRREREQSLATPTRERRPPATPPLRKLLNAAVAYADDIERIGVEDPARAEQLAVERFRDALRRYMRSKPGRKMTDHGQMSELGGGCPPRATRSQHGQEGPQREVQEVRPRVRRESQRGRRGERGRVQGNAGVARGDRLRLLRNADVRAVISAVDSEVLERLTLTRDERLEALSEIAADMDQKTRDRLKAFELLGKSLGDFTERLEV